MLRICAPATLVIAIVLLAPAGAAAQAAAAERPAPTEQATEATPRTPWGDPDLGGIWDFRTITPLERPEQYGDRAFLTQEEAVTLEQGAAQTDREANEAPAERTEAGGNIGAYNRFWFDFGTSVVADRRTSLIVDPPNGRRPPRTPEGEQRPLRRASFRGNLRSRSRTSTTSIAVSAPRRFRSSRRLQTKRPGFQPRPRGVLWR